MEHMLYVIDCRVLSSDVPSHVTRGQGSMQTKPSLSQGTRQSCQAESIPQPYIVTGSGIAYNIYMCVLVCVGVCLLVCVGVWVGVWVGGGGGRWVGECGWVGE